MGPTLSEVPTEVLADLAGIATLQELSAASTLFEIDTPADAFYVIVEGEVRSRRGDTEVAVSGPGSEVGVLAVLDGRPRAVTAVTSTATVLLRIGSEDFLDLVDQYPSLARGVMKQLATEVRRHLKHRTHGPGGSD